MRVPLEIERQVHCRDQFVLKLPWLIADNPAYIGILGHPGGQHLLALHEVM